MIIVKTKRLVLKELADVDAPFIYQLMNTPKWLEFIGDRGIKNEVDATQYITTSIRTSYVQKGFGSYKICLKETNTPIGMCGLLQRDYLGFPDLGFSILPQYERKGYILEASQAVLTYAKNTLYMKTILAITKPENVASLGVLMKLGFKKYSTVQPGEAKELLLTLRKNL